MAHLEFHIQKILAEEGISPYRFAKSLSKFGVSEATAYAIAAGRSQPTFKTLASIIEALRDMTPKEYDVPDLLSFVEDE